MSRYFKFLKLFLVLIVGAFLLVGCEEDKPKKVDVPTDSPSQNESSVDGENSNNQNNDGSSQDEETNNELNTQNEDTSYFDKVETIDIYAERQLKIEIKPPLKNFYVTWNEKPQHYVGGRGSTFIDYSYNILYFPEWGYIGNDGFSVKIKDNDTNKVYIKKFIIRG